MKDLLGTGIALITPFDDHGRIDFKSLEKLIEFQISNGVDYLVLLGTTSEVATLKQDEKDLIISTVIKINKGRIPIVLGIGGNNTLAIVEHIKQANLSGIDALLSVCPYYNKPTQEGIYEHYKTIVKSTSLGVILYNVPGRTGINILPETVLRLAEIPNIIGIKEAKDDMYQILKLIQLKPKDFLVISGDDMLALPCTLSGGSGVISVIAQAFPSEFSKMIRWGLSQKNEEALSVQYKIQDFIELIFSEGSPTGIKKLLEILNFCGSNVRLPLVKASKNLEEKLKKSLKLFHT